jgi:hypothetical protein
MELTTQGMKHTLKGIQSNLETDVNNLVVYKRNPQDLSLSMMKARLRHNP